MVQSRFQSIVTSTESQILKTGTSLEARESDTKDSTRDSSRKRCSSRRVSGRSSRHSKKIESDGIHIWDVSNSCSYTSEDDDTVSRNYSRQQSFDKSFSRIIQVKRKEKGKKKKKTKQAESTTSEATTATEPPVDVEIDILADLLNINKPETEEEVLTVTTLGTKSTKKKKAPKKKGKKTKLTPAEIERMQEEEAELERIRAEEERERLENERRIAIEKEKREMEEQSIRDSQLLKSCRFIDELLAHVRHKTWTEKEQHQWNLYVNCDYLPNPSKCDAMNTYLHIWQLSLENVNMEDTSRRTSDVVKLLEDLDDLIDTALENESKNVINWKWIQKLFREQQQESLDIVTYKLLRNIKNNLNRIDIPHADYNFADDNMKMCLWLRVPLPIPLPNPRRPPKPRIEISFPNINMTVLFPTSLECENMVIRAMYLSYDHLSDLCKFFEDPKYDEVVNVDLYKFCKNEFCEKLKYKFDNRRIVMKRVKVQRDEPKNEDQDEEDELYEEIEVFDKLGTFEDIRLVPYQKLEPTASEFVLDAQEKYLNDLKTNSQVEMSEHVINLRKFTILGGVFLLNLLKLPPQPQEFVTIEMTITPLSLPKKLEHVPFYISYSPPPPPEPGVRRLPEEIEEEMKKQEMEMDKLMLVSLSWPEQVIFLELPLVCYWDEEENVWTKKDVHDLKHNEEKATLSFRTGRFGTFALVAYRYANLPFQAWDMKPESDGSITLQLTTAILMLEFNVKNGLVCLTQLQNSPNLVLQDKIGIYYKLHVIKRIMLAAGVDIFPAPDAFCYVQAGTCEKHWPMEKHLYYNMAAISNSFNFSWSRWNLTADRRSIIMQMREYHPDKTKQKNHLTLLVTPLKASYIDCTEVSQVFNPVDLENLKFSSDLYHLMQLTSNISVRRKVLEASNKNIYALSELLISTRMLSLS